MLSHPTLDLLTRRGLHGMAKGFRDLDAQPEASRLEHAEWLGLRLVQKLRCRRENHKRLFRLYREEKLAVRRRGGRKRAIGTRAPMLMPLGPNERWSLEAG